MARTLALFAALLLAVGPVGCDGPAGDGDGDGDGDADVDGEDGGDGDADGDGGEGCAGEVVVAFTHVGVIPMTEAGPAEDQTVVVTDGRICATGPAAEVAPPAGATLVDGRGLWLVPGLADMHVHLNQPEDLLLYVANGVTTVRVMWGFPQTLELREQIRGGELLGPEIWTTGPLMDGYPPYWPGCEVVTSTAQALSSVRAQAEAGYDFIKVYSRLGLPVYDAIVEAAAEVDMPVVGHVPDAVGLEHALISGQQTFEHLLGYDLEESDGRLEAMTAELGAWNCPTLVVWDHMARVDELRGAPPEGIEHVHPALAESWATSEAYAEHPIGLYERKVGELFELGAPIVAGTDASNPYVLPGYSLHDELALLEASGLTTSEALEATTVAAAELLGTLDRSGTIEVGKDADLVLVEGDFFESLDRLRHPAGVVVKGRWLPRDELEGLLADLDADLAARYGLDFDCGFPEGFDSSAADDHLLLRVAGAIGDPAGDGEYLAREAEVRLGAESLDVARSFGYAEVDGASDLAISTFGVMEPTGVGEHEYGYLSVTLPRSALVAAHEAGLPDVDVSAAEVWVARVELRMDGVDDLYRLCPLAVRDPAATDDGLWACTEGDETFGVGEPLRLAARITLTTDPDAITEVMGAPGCFCWKNVYEPLDCADF